MNSYLFVLSIIDIICVVCIVVVYEIRLGRMKEVAAECYKSYIEDYERTAGEVELIKALQDEVFILLKRLIKELQDEVSRREPGEKTINKRFLDLYDSGEQSARNPWIREIMEEAQKRG